MGFELGLNGLNLGSNGLNEARKGRHRVAQGVSPVFCYVALAGATYFFDEIFIVGVVELLVVVADFVAVAGL